jgi:hypothetical protein
MNKDINQFPYGLMDTVDAQTIPQGASSKSKNFISYGDRIELRKGYDILGADAGIGKVTGLHTAIKADGSEIVFRKIGRKLEYYNPTTDLWVEVGSDLFPVAALSDECFFANYNSLAGVQLFFSSPNSGLYKIMVANPDSYTDLTNASKNFKGYIKIKYNRMLLWGRNEDPTGKYGSYIDTQTFTTVSAEALGSVASGTLAFKAGDAHRTCFGVSITITGTGEVYTDDYNGLLTGSLGGTGTINYTTGAFTTTGSGAGTATYQWEDSTNTGIADFTKSSPRTAGQGFVFRQDDGGALKTAATYGDTEYDFHEKNTYELTLTNTDTGATNLPYRERVGVSSIRGACATGDGVFFVDDLDKADPQFRLLTLEKISSLVIPRSVSKRKTKEGIVLGVNLEAYYFDKAAVFEFADFILFSCRTKNSTENDTTFIFNRKNGSIDKTDYYANCFALYNGGLIVGDSLSGNVYQAFSGYDDDDSLIDNYWEGDLSQLQVDELKKVKKFIPRGYIQPDQTYDIYLSLDNGGYTYIGTIKGSGTYVDKGQAVTIGSLTIGTAIVGGGSPGDQAYYYEHPFPLHLDKFNRIKVRFVATGLGFVSINGYQWFDIRKFGNKTTKKYR